MLLAHAVTLAEARSYVAALADNNDALVRPQPPDTVAVAHMGLQHFGEMPQHRIAL